MSIKLEAVLTASDKATGVIRSAQAAAISLNDRALKGLKSFDAFNAKVGAGIKTAVTTVATAGVVLGGVGAKIIGVGMDFEKTMSGVAAVSGATEDEFQSLKKRALELGATGNFGATQVAGAFEIMSKAGLKVNDILAGTPGLLSAAAADGATIEETATSLMSSMKALGLGPQQMQLFADKMSKAGDSTAASIGTISQSLAIAGPIFKQLNVPLDDAIGMIALLQDRGIDASSAGTTLAASFSKLASPMGRTKIALKELGIEVADSYGNMKPPQQLLKEVLGATSKIKGNVGKMAAVTELVGLESQKALLNVMDAAGSGALQDLIGSLGKADGYADTIAKKRLDNFAGDWTLLTNSVDAFSTKLFGLESGPLRSVVQRTTEWVNANADLVATDIVGMIETAIPLVDNFGDGMRAAFEDSYLIKTAKWLGKVFGLFDSDGENARLEAYQLGRTITQAGIAFGGLVFMTKAASAATLTFQFVTKATRIVVLAWEGAVKLVRAAMYTYQIATHAGVGATLAMSVASKAAAVDAGLMKTGIMGASGGFTAMAATAGAAALAIGSIYAAWLLLDKFQKENGGWEGVAGFLGTDGGRGGFEGVDDVMNRQTYERDKKAGRYDDALSGSVAPKTAQALAFDKMMFAPKEVEARRFDAPIQPGQYAGAFGFGGGMAPPPAAPAPVYGPQLPNAEEFHAMVKQELTVNLKTDPGTTAEVTKKPEGAKVNVKPSGKPL